MLVCYIEATQELQGEAQAPTKGSEEMNEMTAPELNQYLENIAKLIGLRDEIGGPEVLIGAGVNAGVIAMFRREIPGAVAFHMSGKTEIESGMRFRREGVPMGLPGLDEWHIQQTGETAVRDARNVLYG